MPAASPPLAPNLTAVTLYRERRANRGAACTLMMLPLTLLPASIASQAHAQSPSTQAAPRRPSTYVRAARFANARAEEWPEHRAGGQASPQAWLVERRASAMHDTAVAASFPLQEIDTVATARARRAQRGHDALQAGDLARAQAELADAEFARSEAGVALQCAVAQRAIYLGDAARAVAIFSALEAAGHALQPAEYRQWFALLLQMRKLDAAHALQDTHADLQVPLQQLAMAHALAEAGREPELVTCLASRQPAFTREAQERQWLYLLAHVEARRPDLLARFRVRFAANRDVQERLAATGALARHGQGAARHVLASAAAGGFSEARFDLALRAGRFDEAQRWCARAACGARTMHSVA
jgi:adsorption protein A